MAIVWLARPLSRLGELVVAKMLLPQYAMDENFQQMFLDEARIASGIQHPNVARILDTGEAEGTPYIAMEYVDGEPLARITQAVKKSGKPFPMGVALRIVADACAGLHAAHELRDRSGVLLGVVHRDVSPQNILVRATGTAAVIDFGIAKARDRLAEETRAGNLKGKVRYMAPEQARAKEVDRRVDVWALGAVLFELFSGKGPYEGGSEIASLQRLVKGGAPADLPPAVPAPVREIVARALAPSVDERYGTAEELQHALSLALPLLGDPTDSASVARFAAPFMKDRSRARSTAASEAMATLDAEGARAPARPTAASSEFLPPLAEDQDDAGIDDEATRVDMRFAAATDSRPSRTLALAPPSPSSEAPRTLMSALPSPRSEAPRTVASALRSPDSEPPRTLALARDQLPPRDKIPSNRPFVANQIAQSIMEVLGDPPSVRPSGSTGPPDALSPGADHEGAAPVVLQESPRFGGWQPVANPQQTASQRPLPVEPRRSWGRLWLFVLVLLLLAAGGTVFSLRHRLYPHKK